MRPIEVFYESLIKFAYKQGPHGPHITRYSMYRSLKNRLAAEDSADKCAIVVSGSEYLANLLGLHKTQKLSLPYPEFTLDNLALLSDSYDFIVSDQVLEHCKDIHDVATETIRVLKPGAWFVHTTCFINVVHGAPSDYWRFTPSVLARMFPQTSHSLAEGWGNRVATMIMEAGYRMSAVPDDVNNPIHVLATHNEADWPITVWVVGQKAQDGNEISATTLTRKAKPQSYSFAPTAARTGVVTCIRNEAPYLLEWIAHYRVLGFEQIVIYDNESNDASADILGPLADAGAIQAVYWKSRPGENKQVGAYNDAVARLNGLIEWCAFLDLDEFLVLDEGTTLESILPTDAATSALGIPWRIYGSNGQTLRRRGLTIERFTTAATDNNDHVKSMVRLADVQFMNVHVPQLKSGAIMDLEGVEIEYSTRGKLGRVTNGPARINHYFCRSKEEFECKRIRGRGAVAPGQSDEIRDVSAFLSMDANEVEATSALAMAPLVHAEVARLRKLIRA